MEDRPFYVVCNWASEENDLLKVMLMTTKQCQTVLEEKKMKKWKRNICAQLKFMRKKVLFQRKNICDYKKCKCGVLSFWLSFNFY